MLDGGCWLEKMGVEGCVGCRGYVEGESGRNESSGGGLACGMRGSQ